MLDWYDLVHLPGEELGRLDIAEVNLACAAGLPGTEWMDARLCLDRIKYFAQRVRESTERRLPDFHRRPEHYDDSEAYFRVLNLVTVLQRDLGVRYNPAKIPLEADLDPADTFLFGILQGDGGTCASMPVLYAAVGRRLGYPIKLVRAKRHLFCRWEDVCQRFNIEATQRGLLCHPDDHYRTGMYACDAEREREFGFLHSLPPREELAGFLSERAFCWHRLGMLREAVECFAWAAELQPERQRAAAYWCMQSHHEWKAAVRKRLPPHVPMLNLRYPAARRFRAMPENIERLILSLRVLEDFLDDQELGQKLWAPSRQNPGQRPSGMPQQLQVSFAAPLKFNNRPPRRVGG
jgi:hypothetical protein